MYNRQYLYWKYTQPTENSAYFYGCFEKSPYKDNFIYIYAKENVKLIDYFPIELADFIYSISKIEEDRILDDMGIKGKYKYYMLLEELGFANYNLYALAITETSLKILQELKNKGCKMFKKTKKSTLNQERLNTNQDYDRDNSNEEMLYIILRNDLNATLGEQMSYVAKAASALGCNDINNIVILQANATDLFIENKIPAKYDDTSFSHARIVETAKRIGHGNFVLNQPELVALGYKGVKKYIPKFVKRLALFNITNVIE